MDLRERKLVICMEECGELVQACSKIMRFGLTPKKYSNLVEEMGDVLTMLEMLGAEFEIDATDLDSRVMTKRAKLKKYEGIE